MNKKTGDRDATTIGDANQSSSNMVRTGLTLFTWPGAPQKVHSVPGEEAVSCFTGALLARSSGSTKYRDGKAPVNSCKRE